MKLNSSQLEAFFAIAHTLNFTKAADTLHVTQSALSQRIAKLEADLETTLFIRDRTSIRLTEAGEQVLRFCQLNEQAESELLSNLKETGADFAGTLRVGGFSSVTRSLVIPAIAKLVRANPRLSVQLISRELRDLPRLLKSAEVDYIVTNRKSDSADVESVFLGIEDNVLTQAKKIRTENIFLDHDANDPTTKAYFARFKRPLKPANMRYLDDVYGLLDGVKNGLGMAVLPMHLIEQEKDLEILEPKRRLAVPVYLNFYVQPFYKRLHAVFLNEMKGHFHTKLRQNNAH